MDTHAANQTIPFRQCTTFFSLHTSTILITLATIYIVFTSICTLFIYRLLRILTRPKQPRRVSQATQPFSNDKSPKGNANQGHHHLLIVLGSGGHTSEMLSILQTLGAEYLNTRFTRRTWVISSGDGFSAERARVFEEKVSREWAATTPKRKGKTEKEERSNVTVHWDIATVTRARKIHQPLYTTPFSALVCLWECLQLLLRRGVSPGSDSDDGKRVGGMSPAPDLILTNGPGTGVIVVLASLVLLILGLAPLQGNGSMRCVYVESWARVKTLSLSGKMLRWVVARFLVQWKGLADYDATAVVQEEEDSDKKKKVHSNSAAVGGTGGASVVEAGRSSLLPRKVEYIGAVVT